MVQYVSKNFRDTVMKTLVLFFVSLVAVLVSGCASSGYTTITRGTDVYEGVIVNSMGNVFGHGDDRITVYNNYTPGYLVDFMRDSRVVIQGIPSGQAMTMHPHRRGYREEVLFSSRVYRVEADGTRTDVPGALYQRIVSLSDHRSATTVSWTVTPKGTRVNSRRVYRKYYDY